MFINFWKVFHRVYSHLSISLSKGLRLFIFIWNGKRAPMLIPRNSFIPDDRLCLLMLLINEHANVWVFFRFFFRPCSWFLFHNRKISTLLIYWFLHKCSPARLFGTSEKWTICLLYSQNKELLKIQIKARVNLVLEPSTL